MAPVRSVELEDLPPCVFMHGDPWFGKAFIGDDIYMTWYYDTLDALYYDDSFAIGDNDSYSDDEDTYWDD